MIKRTEKYNIEAGKATSFGAGAKHAHSLMESCIQQVILHKLLSLVGSRNGEDIRNLLGCINAKS